MEFFGRSPILKRDYFIAKSSFFSIVFLIIMQFLGLSIRQYNNPILILVSGVFVVIGIIIILAGIFNLGNSIRMGLPSTKTRFRTDGLYRFSRNPIYLGFIVVDIAGFFYTANIIVLALAIVAMIYHHKIILGEESFLEKSFGKEYMSYKKRVRRYF